MRFSNRTKTILIAVASLSVLIIIGSILYNIFKNARLTIIVAPTDAEVYINGSRKGSGTIDTFPGKVNIRISKDGMDTKEFTVDLESHKTATVYAYLTQDGSLDYYKDDKASYEILKLIADEDADKFIQEQERIVSIRSILPLSRYTSGSNGRTGGMSGSETLIEDATNEDCKKIICLKLTDNTGSDETAKALLKENGYDFEDYYFIGR